MIRFILLFTIFNLTISNCNGQSSMSCFNHGFDKWKIGDPLKSITGLRVLTANDGNNLSLRYDVPQSSIYAIDGPALEGNYCNFGKPEKVFFIENSDTIKYIIARFPYNEKLMDSILNDYTTIGTPRVVMIMSSSNISFEKNDFAVYLNGYMVSIFQVWDENNRPFVDIIIHNWKRKLKTEN